MADDPRRYLTLTSRSQHFPQLYSYVETALARRATEGCLIQAGLPMHFSGTPPDIRHPAPGLGKHTDEVLQKIHKAH